MVGAAAVDDAFGRAAVDIAVDGYAACSVAVLTQREVHIAVDPGCRAVTAAVDIGRLGGGAHLAAVDVHGYVAANGAGNIGTSIYTSIHLAACHIYRHGVTLFLIRTAKYGSIHLSSGHIQSSRSVGIAKVATAKYIILYITLICYHNIGVVHPTCGCLSCVATSSSENISVGRSVERQVRGISNVGGTSNINIGVGGQCSSGLVGVGTITSSSHPSIDSAAGDDETAYAAGSGKGSRAIHHTSYGAAGHPDEEGLVRSIIVLINTSCYTC